MELFRHRGYTIVDFEQRADVYVINTCTVTRTGDRKSRQIIRRAARANPDAVVAVTGCYAQTAPDEILEIEGVDLVVGMGERNRIVDLVEEMTREKSNGVQAPRKVVPDVFASTEFEEIPVEHFAGRTRATLKIQEGCDQFCAYCKIPYARGPSRSRHLDSVVAEARRLARAGFKEIVLTGIHLGAYGRDLDPPLSLVDVIEAIHDIEGLHWIRLGSIDAPEIDSALIRALKDYEKVCRHLHIPLQAGDDAVLKRMRRPYTTGDYRRVVEQLREILPHMGLTTDIIVGFPGETDAQFENTLQFVREMAFTRLHVFPYSPRAGTPAARFPDQIPGPRKQERTHRMIELGKELSARFHEKFIGKMVEVLWEQPVEDGDLPLWEGLTETYVRVEARVEGDWAGQIQPVHVEGADAEGVWGKIMHSICGKEVSPR